MIDPSSRAGPSRPPDQSPVTGPALAANIHSILSSRTPINHPLCTECTALLQSELQRQLEELTRERDAYLKFERGILRNREKSKTSRARLKDQTDPDEGLDEYGIQGTEEEWQALHRQKKQLEDEETMLRKELEEKEKRLADVRKDAERTKLEEEEVEKEEASFLVSHAALSAERKRLMNTLHSARTHLLLSQRLLSHLESTNVYNDAFQIGGSTLAEEYTQGTDSVIKVMSP